MTSFKAPTSQELARDFLWRIHANVPQKGYIGVFNRSHYEDVLIVRVKKLDPEKTIEKLLANSSDNNISKIYKAVIEDKSECNHPSEHRWFLESLTITLFAFFSGILIIFS